MGKETEQAQEDALESLKRQVFASAFGSFDPQSALKEYYKVFEKEDDTTEEGVDEFQPESPEDVLEMINTARRAGAIK